MKAKLEVSFSVVRQHGATTAVVLALVQNNVTPVSVTDIAKMMDISYPTAQKCLKALHQNSLVTFDGKMYHKI